jgi:3-oxoacyl-[acyl-carrier-protein] synthase II
MTAAAVAPDQIVISAWSAVSPYGIGHAAFSEGIGDRRDPALPIDPEMWKVVDKYACLVPDFDLRRTLGAKGTRSMDRLTGLAVTAVGQLIDEAGLDQGPSWDDETGLVLGTGVGNAESVMNFVRSSLTGAKPFYVDPGKIPYVVMNAAAGRCAIRYQMRGPNATIAAGRAAGLFALSYARRLLLTKRAPRILCGAVEEYSDTRSWLEFHSRAPGAADTVLGEGCGLLLVEPLGRVSAGRRPLAALLSVSFRICLDEDVRGAMAACVARALELADAQADEVWAASPSGAGGAAGRQEQDALREVFGNDALGRVAPAALLGDTSAASAAFQIAAVLSAAHGAPQAAGKVAAITSICREGTVACALIRLLGDERLSPPMAAQRSET